MRHRNHGRKLNRTASHRKALMRNLANQLIEHKELRTTTAKAKEARGFVERLITYAKKGKLHHRRLAFGFLRQKNSVDVLFDEIAPAFSERAGGYTRVIKLGNRPGDGAPISLLQLVGFEKLEIAAPESKKKKSRKQPKKEIQTEATEAKVIETAESEEIKDTGEKAGEAAEIVEEKLAEVSEKKKKKKK